MASSVAKSPSHPGAPTGPTDYLALYQAPSFDRIQIIKRGVAATDAKAILARFSLTQAALLKALNVSAATMNRKATQAQTLGTDESERILGIAKLIGQIEAMTLDAEDFDASAWLSQWIDEPLPAFGGKKPIDFLDTMEGQALVSDTLAQMQSGAYA